MRELDKHAARATARVDRAAPDSLKGVHINDPKAMFLLRWYQERDAKGQLLTDPPYQNKACKEYFLPLDNGGYPFEWVSNHGVLTMLHLKPHKSKNRTFTLPAGDKRTADQALREHSA